MSDENLAESPESPRLITSVFEEGYVPQTLERLEIKCSNIGLITVHIQGIRSSHEVVILTVQDLGCDYEMYQDFVDNPRMIPIRDRTVWLHVSPPGQGRDEADLPADYEYPTISAIADDLVDILDFLEVKQVVCFGEGAGANILARFSISHNDRVLGACLCHMTGSSAGLFESIKEKMMRWNLADVGMNPTAENYLVIHRFGGFTTSKANDKEEFKAMIEGFQTLLRKRTNFKNLKQFVEAFLKRSSIGDSIKNLKCPVLMVSGQLSVFNQSTRDFYKTLGKWSSDKSKIDFIEVTGVANLLEEQQDKLAECFQYFLQGLGLVAGVPMIAVMTSLPRNRRLSMEDYDKPTQHRKMSSGIFPPERKCSVGIQSERKMSTVTGELIPDRKISIASARLAAERKISVCSVGKATERKISTSSAAKERKISTSSATEERKISTSSAENTAERKISTSSGDMSPSTSPPSKVAVMPGMLACSTVSE